MEHLLDTAPGCYFSFNDEGILLHVNQTICVILGYSKSELEGLRAEMIFTIPTRIFYQTHFFPLIKMQGHAEEIFIFLAAKNGTQVPVLMNAKRRETAEGFSNDCLCIIVTQRKKFEDELVAARKQAEAASKENTELTKAKEELVRHLQQLDEHMVLVKKQNQELKQFNRV